VSELQMKATRVAYGETLASLAASDLDIVVLDADLSQSTMTAMFKKTCASRFVNTGIAEQNMMAVAGGLAASGLTVFASTFAVFATGRAYDQIRQNIAHNRANVKIVASHSGLTVGEDGASHQALEDIALMRALPNMSVICPADAVETASVIEAIARDDKPYYVRLGRPPVPIIFGDDYMYTPGKSNVLREGTDVAVFATGHMVFRALRAHEMLKQEGISSEIVNVHTIKPLDEEAVVASARKCGAVVTVEEHSIIGGLGSAICETLCEKQPTRVVRLGVRDVFGESGTPDGLLEAHGLSAAHIAAQCKKVVSEKRQ